MSEPVTASLPCPPWRRLFGLVYEALAVVAIVMVIGLLCQLATGGQLIATGPHTVIAWWYPPLQGVVVASYFLISWLRGGQTLGMRPWHVCLTSGGGQPPSLRQALIRLLVAALPLLLLELAPRFGLRIAIGAVLAGWVLWWLPTLFDPRRRAVHDLAADTELRLID
jgi:uncharacterized RDD family membrane protein YckC